jgi:hypothetical protein
MEELTSKPFVLIERKAQANGDIQLRYGESKDDPTPFILTVTAAYVAAKTGKSPANHDEVLHYVENQATVLSLIAVHQRTGAIQQQFCRNVSTPGPCPAAPYTPYGTTTFPSGPKGPRRIDLRYLWRSLWRAHTASQSSSRPRFARSRSRRSFKRHLQIEFGDV